MVGLAFSGGAAGRRVGVGETADEVDDGLVGAGLVELLLGDGPGLGAHHLSP